MLSRFQAHRRAERRARKLSVAMAVRIAGRLGMSACPDVPSRLMHSPAMQTYLDALASRCARAWYLRLADVGIAKQHAEPRTLPSDRAHTPRSDAPRKARKARDPRDPRDRDPSGARYKNNDSSGYLA